MHEARFYPGALCFQAPGSVSCSSEQLWLCGGLGAFPQPSVLFVPGQITAWLSPLLSNIQDLLQDSEINIKDKRDFWNNSQVLLHLFDRLKIHVYSFRVDISEMKRESKKKSFKWFLKTECIISCFFFYQMMKHVCSRQVTTFAVFSIIFQMAIHWLCDKREGKQLYEETWQFHPCYL